MANRALFQLRYCERGHVVTSYDPRFGDDRCAACGTAFVDRCRNCDAQFDRSWETPTYVGGKPAQKPPVPPSCCTKCGKPFPWTGHNTGGEVEVDAVRLVRRLCDRFPLVVRELGRRHEGRTPLKIADEYDVQDLFRALLALDFDDVRAEEVTPSYAGKSGQIDFLIKGDSIGIEGV